METKIVKNGLLSIASGIEMLNDSKQKHMSTLAEISIILGSPETSARFGLDEKESKEDITSFLSAIHFLMKDLSNESVKAAIKLLDNQIFSSGEENEYKTKYEKALVQINGLQEELLSLRESINA